MYTVAKHKRFFFICRLFIVAVLLRFLYSFYKRCIVSLYMYAGIRKGLLEHGL